MLTPNNQTRITGTAEQAVLAGRGVLFGIVPEATTTGTVTLRDNTALGGAAFHTCAVGLTQQGKFFSENGVRFNNGLTVQLSVGTDAVTVIWAPTP